MIKLIGMWEDRNPINSEIYTDKFSYILCKLGIANSKWCSSVEGITEGMRAAIEAHKRTEELFNRGDDEN